MHYMFAIFGEDLTKSLPLVYENTSVLFLRTFYPLEENLSIATVCCNVVIGLIVRKHIDKSF